MYSDLANRVNLLEWLLLIGTFLAALLILLPWVRLRERRRASREHPPQAGEMWMEDGSPLYISAVSSFGVESLMRDAATQEFIKRVDGWADWATRLSEHVVYFTGERRPFYSGHAVERFVQ